MMADKIRQDGINPEMVKAIDVKEVDYVALTKLAIDHSDAIVQCSPNIKPEILELVQASGLPFLPYDENDTSVKRYGDFYESL